MQFCEEMMNKLDRYKISYFADELAFMLNGKVNRQNCRYWLQENIDNVYTEYLLNMRQ